MEDGFNQEAEKSYFNEVNMLSQAIEDAGLNKEEGSADRESEIEKIAMDLFGEGYPEHEVHDIIAAYYGQES